MREFKWSYFNVYTILKDIVRNLWVIVLAALIGFLGVRSYYKCIYSPEYSSSMVISISATNEGAYAYSSLNKTIEAASTFQEMFQSTYFKEKLTDIMGIDVNGTITAVQVEQTNLITLSYTCSSPIDAYKVLVGVYENYNDITDHNFSNMIINSITYPQVPVSPSNSVGYGSNDKIAAAAIAVIVTLLIVLISYFRDTVKNDTDVNELLNTQLFAVVKHEEKNKSIRSKLRFTHSRDPLLITDVLIDADFVEAFNKCIIKLDYLSETKKVKTIMVSSLGENEGKTTIAVNLAIASAKFGKKTLLMDLDLRKPAIFKFFKKNHDGEFSGVGEILSSDSTVKESVWHDKDTGLYVLCGKKQYRNSSELLSSHKFEALMKALREQFDIVIIDTSPSSLVADAEIVAAYSDSALIVVRQDIAPVPEINDMLDVLTQSGTNVLGCVFNDYHIVSNNFQQ